MLIFAKFIKVTIKFLSSDCSPYICLKYSLRKLCSLSHSKKTQIFILSVYIGWPYEIDHIAYQLKGNNNSPLLCSTLYCLKNNSTMDDLNVRTYPIILPFLYGTMLSKLDVAKTNHMDGIQSYII